MALNYDLDIEQGSDYAISIPIVDDDNVPVVVTGWTARLQIRRTPTSPVARVSFTTDGEQVDGVGLEIDGAFVILRIPGTMSALWSWVDSFYDLELQNPDGGIFRVASGRVYLNREVTR